MPNWSSHIPTFRQQLTAALTELYGSGEAHAHIRLLMEYLGESPWHNQDAHFEEATHQKAQQAAQQLLQEVPIQHITGWGHFYGRDFRVGPEVLIPRPETEGLLVWARDTLLHLPSPTLTALDIGTGSGCLAISLELELREKGRKLRSTGYDVSPEALALARENAHLLASETACVQGDVLTATPSDFQQLDILISNPPYVPQQESESLRKQVRDHEPHLALFVPNHDPLLFYRKIAELGRHWLKFGGFLFFETHADYGQAVHELMVELGYQSVELRQDLEGRDRMVRGRR